MTVVFSSAVFSGAVGKMIEGWIKAGAQRGRPASSERETSSRRIVSRGISGQHLAVLAYPLLQCGWRGVARERSNARTTRQAAILSRVHEELFARHTHAKKTHAEHTCDAADALRARVRRAHTEKTHAEHTRIRRAAGSRRQTKRCCMCGPHNFEAPSGSELFHVNHVIL
ncbi:hypothetical protein T492DRAFT_875703 [Pavlovales sp. CCMP2436]|nr:hypothetical protein T492DRAFT_875703 [Pavlovales sp. CCMP2436]